MAFQAGCKKIQRGRVKACVRKANFSEILSGLLHGPHWPELLYGHLWVAREEAGKDNSQVGLLDVSNETGSLNNKGEGKE